MSDKNQIKIELKDPEPISLALGIFTALTGAAGLIIQSTQYYKERKRSKAEIRKFLFEADRALNRLDEAYRSIISIYDEHECLYAPFAIGKNAIWADRKLLQDLDRLQSNIFYSGRDLQAALTEIASLLDRDFQNEAYEISKTLEDLFHNARMSKKLLEFLINLGKMMEIVSEFIYRLCKKYGIKPTSIRVTLIRDTIEHLSYRLK